MAGAIELATAYIALVPSLKGASKGISDQLNPAASKAGSESGGILGGSLMDNVKKFAGPVTGIIAGLGIKAAASESVDAFKDVAGEVNSLKRLMGSSAEDASRMRYVFSTVGLSVDDTKGALGIFSKNMVNAQGDAKKTADLTEKLGTSFLDASGHIKPMGEILPGISDKFKSMADGPEKTALAMQLFGRSGASMIPALNKGSGAMEELMAKSDELGLTLTGDNLAAWGESKKQARDFQASLDGLKVQIGAAILPVLNQLTGFVRGSLIPIIMHLTQQWKGLDSGTKSVITTIAGIVAVAAPAVLIFGKFASAISSIAGVVKSVTGVFGLLNAVMAANPIVLIVLAIAALVAGLIWAYNNIGWFKDGVDAVFKFIVDALSGIGNFFTDVWNGIFSFLSGVWNAIVGAVVGYVTWYFTTIHDGFMAVWNFISGIFNAIAGFIGGVWNWIVSLVTNILKAFWKVHGDQITAIWNFIVSIFTAIGDFFIGVWNWYIGIVVGVLTAIWNVISSVFNAVSDFIGAVFGAIGDFISGIWNSIVGTISGAVTAVWNFISAGFGMVWAYISSVFGMVAGYLGGIWGNIVDGVSGMIGQVGGFFSGLWGTITSALSGAGTWLFNAGTDIVNGLFDGIKSLAGTIGNFFLSLLPGWIVEPFKIALDIHSPSRVFRKFGQNIGQGLMLGTEDTKNEISTTMRGLVTVPDMPAFGAPSASIAGGGSRGAGTTFNTTINQVDDPIGTAHAVTRRQLALSS